MNSEITTCTLDLGLPEASIDLGDPSCTLDLGRPSCTLTFEAFGFYLLLDPDGDQLLDPDGATLYVIG